MTRRLLTFTAGCVAAWLVLLAPAGLVGGGPGAVGLSIAAALCGIPAVLSLAIAEWFAGSDPEKTVAAAVAGTVLRMGFVLGGAALLVKLFPALVAGGDLLFWGWVILFYLITLAWEVVFVTRRPAARTAPPTAAAAPGTEPNTLAARAN